MSAGEPLPPLGARYPARAGAYRDSYTAAPRTARNGLLSSWLEIIVAHHIIYIEYKPKLVELHELKI